MLLREGGGHGPGAEGVKVSWAGTRIPNPRGPPPPPALSLPASSCRPWYAQLQGPRNGSGETLVSRKQLLRAFQSTPPQNVAANQHVHRYSL